MQGASPHTVGCAMTMPQKNSERLDGVKTQIVGLFRADCRLSLMMVPVRRAAAMLLGSGLLDVVCGRTLRPAGSLSTFELEPTFILTQIIIIIIFLTLPLERDAYRRHNIFHVLNLLSLVFLKNCCAC